MRFELFAEPRARYSATFKARAGHVATYATKTAAEDAASVLRRRGVKGVRVIEVGPPVPAPVKPRPVKEYVVDGVRHTVPFFPWTI